MNTTPPEFPTDDSFRSKAEELFGIEFEEELPDEDLLDEIADLSAPVEETESNPAEELDAGFPDDDNDDFIPEGAETAGISDDDDEDTDDEFDFGLGIEGVTQDDESEVSTELASTDDSSDEDEVVVAHSSTAQHTKPLEDWSWDEDDSGFDEGILEEGSSIAAKPKEQTTEDDEPRPVKQSNLGTVVGDDDFGFGVGILESGGDFDFNDDDVWSTKKPVEATIDDIDEENSIVEDVVEKPRKKKKAISSEEDVSFDDTPEKEEEEAPRKKSRRRRRKPRRESESTVDDDATSSESAEDDDDVSDADERMEGRSKSDKYANIPSWEHAISLVVKEDRNHSRRGSRSRSSNQRRRRSGDSSKKSSGRRSQRKSD